MGLKKLVMKILYPHKHDANAYIRFLRSRGATIGQNLVLYNPRSIWIDETSPGQIFIGNDVQITADCKIIAHDYSYSILGNAYHDLPRKQKNVVIGNNVFIGMNSLILMGAHIGDNVIIGAGSIVSGKVESDSVYAGNPARKICSLKQHYLRCREEFENSAKCYLQRLRREGKDINDESLIIYRALYTGVNEMNTAVQSFNLRGMSAVSMRNLKPDYKKYESIDELIEKLEE